MSLHRPRTAETHGIASRTAPNEVSVPQMNQSIQNSSAFETSNHKRSSTMSGSSGGRQSGGSEQGSSIPAPKRPSALPRSTSSSSQARLSLIASTRPMPTFSGKSPTLQGMSLSSSTYRAPYLDTSRAMLSSQPDHGRFMRSASPVGYEDDTVLGLVVPEKPSTYPPANLPPRLIPELQALAASNIRAANPASSSIGSISSPSTQFTTSSSPWSASTTTTTPVSWSSASPANISAPAGSTKRSHTVPMPSTVRARTPKLPALKESQLSNASSKATLAGSEPERTTRKLRKKSVPSPEPTPPPRSSSMKGNRSRSNSTTVGAASGQTEQEPSIPDFPSPPVTMPSRDKKAPVQTRVVTERPVVTQGHSRLQEALKATSRPNTAPASPDKNREHTFRASTLPPQSRQLLEPLPIAQSQHRRFPSLSRRHARGPSASDTEGEKQSARSRLAKFSRMALFGRSKTTDADDKSGKLSAKKGPAAGTGHEGYGKFGRRGRKQSVSSSTGATDSETSVVSTTRRPVERRQSRISSTSQDQSDLDEFASKRSKPVVMIGGSHRGRVNPFPPLPKNAQHSDVSLNTVSSADSYPNYSRLAPPRRERFPPAADESPPTLASRRSQRFGESEDSFRMPEPIDTKALAATPALDSRNTTQSSEVPTPASAMYRVDPGLLEKQKGKSKRMKWNIFRRKDSLSENGERPIERPRTRTGMSVNLAPAPVSRPVPYYAVLGSESEVTTTAAIGQFLKEAQESPEREDEMISIGFSDDEVYENPYAHRESVLLPTAPSRRVFTANHNTELVPQASLSLPQEEMLTREPPQEVVPTRRQPRLAQVGRIPKVVPTRQQNQSGIPAAQAVYQAPVQPQGTIRPKPSRDNLPRLVTQQFPTPDTRATNTMSQNDNNPESQQSQQSQTQGTDPEFLRFSETRNSDFTTSSDSTGIISIMGPPSLQGPVLMNRRSEHGPHEDEVWNEYDDFMDQIMSPSQKTKLPAKQKAGERTIRITNIQNPSTTASAQAKGLAILPEPTLTAKSSAQWLAPPGLALSHLPSLQEMASLEEIRLRRSRIAPALHTSYAPSSPFSMRDFIEEYGRPGSGKYSERLSGSSTANITPTQALAPVHHEHSRPRQYENAAQLEEIERAKNPTKHSDRQYASLMVSRWLSFGRVLFSPADQEIEANPQKHVLVIDGLGNEDWSIYCAVTYQTQQAFVYDLKERRQGKSRGKTATAADSAPPNHRRSEVSSFNDKFPFPPAFFCAIVVRFPPAMPDSKLKNIVSEVRRVLAPGGHLELMVLDLDIVNMGVQTRRAIKDLKIKMSAADRSVSLKPIIDNVQTILGSNGFSNLNRCVVGVPVVGKPAGSLDSSSESRSSSGSAAAHQRRSSAGPRPYGSLGGQANFSLNDLVADHSENADAKIGRMVSKTARSWWQHCFEAGVMTDSAGSKSVLERKEVLNECKQRAANFKLLIAYTQKPAPQAEQRRRTMSEPSVPALATAGPTRPPR